MAAKLKTASRRKTTPPSDNAGKKIEDPHSRFLRLAMPRVNAALKRISMIGNLAANGYQSTESEREQILTALDDAVTAVRVKLEKPAGKQAAQFAFK